LSLPTYPWLLYIRVFILVSFGDWPSSPHNEDNCSQLLEYGQSTSISLRLQGGTAGSARPTGPDDPMKTQCFPRYCPRCRSFLPILVMENPQSTLIRGSTTNSGLSWTFRFSLEQPLARTIVGQFHHLVCQLLKPGGHPWLFPWYFSARTSYADSRCLQRVRPTNLAGFE
jgi:hypothetical protein